SLGARHRQHERHLVEQARKDQSRRPRGRRRTLRRRLRHRARRPARARRRRDGPLGRDRARRRIYLIAEKASDAIIESAVTPELKGKASRVVGAAAIAAGLASAPREARAWVLPEHTQITARGLESLRTSGRMTASMGAWLERASAALGLCP